jgi:riboflavin transporter FmnP
MNKKRMYITAAILILLAIILPLFNVSLPIGNPNFGSTPITLAAVFLPWPVSIIAALIKGITSSLFTGRFVVEISAGIGDALMALLTFWLARRWNKSLSAFIGQLSRYILTAGMVALGVSVAIATGIITAENAPVAGLGTSFFSNLASTWLAICHPALTLSIGFNVILSVIIIAFLGKRIDRFLAPSNPE